MQAAIGDLFEMTQTTSNIAGAINAAHATVEDAKVSIGKAATECGRLLCEAKETVAHGGWDAWLNANCSFSPRTAQLYMRIFRQTKSDPAKAQRVADLSIREIAKVLAEPREQQRPAGQFQAEYDEMVAAWQASESPARVRFAEELHQRGEISKPQYKWMLENLTSPEEAARSVALSLAHHVPQKQWPALIAALQSADAETIIEEMERARVRRTPAA